jgi:uncharacterized protein YaiE (UPF0345 family)
MSHKPSNGSVAPACKSYAELVQKLSAFIGRLEWMAPLGHGGQDLCHKAYNVLSHALDEVLESARHSHDGPSQPDYDFSAGSTVPASESNAALDSTWLDSIDWTTFMTDETFDVPGNTLGTPGFDFAI